MRKLKNLLAIIGGTIIGVVAITAFSICYTACLRIAEQEIVMWYADLRNLRVISAEVDNGEK